MKLLKDDQPDVMYTVAAYLQDATPLVLLFDKNKELMGYNYMSSKVTYSEYVRVADGSTIGITKPKLKEKRVEAREKGLKDTLDELKSLVDPVKHEVEESTGSKLVDDTIAKLVAVIRLLKDKDPKSESLAELLKMQATLETLKGAI